MRVAVVTPVFEESAQTLRRCFASVARQTVACGHFVVCDGRDPSTPPPPGARVVRLERSVADSGDTPRAIGSLLAIREGFEALAYLDADNFYAPDHLETMVRTVENAGCDMAVASRVFVRADGTRLPVRDEPPQHHADTNCLFLGPRTLWAAELWAQGPRRMAAVTDRLVWGALRANDVRWAWVRRPTVAYWTRYPRHYLDAGETPPPDAKDIWPDQEAQIAWWKSLPSEEKRRLLWRMRVTRRRPSEGK